MTEIEDLRRTLTSAKAEYESLGSQEKARISAYQAERKQRQLHAFLDNFEIKHSKIKGVGPAKEAALASYGIDTAADITLAKVLAAPGFGDSNSQALLDWRKSIERRFVYNLLPNDIDRQEVGKIRASIGTRLTFRIRRT